MCGILMGMKTQTEHTKMVKVAEAAKAAGVSRWTIHLYIKDGVVRIDKKAYNDYGVLRVNLNDVLETADRRAEMRYRRRPDLKPKDN
jgi:predicted site-specific integrase-resolvase